LPTALATTTLILTAVAALVAATVAVAVLPTALATLATGAFGAGLTALAAGFGGQLTVLRETPLLVRDTLAALAGNLALLLIVHCGKAALLVLRHDVWTPI
jgi:hypothetical protein